MTAYIKYAMEMQQPEGADRLPHRKLTDWVTAYLRDSIMGGRLKPGERLTMISLANKLDVSVTPVREALLRLQEEGVVVGDAHKSFRVASVTLEDIRDFHQLHGFISGLLAERAAEKLTEEDFAELDKLDAAIIQASAEGDHVRMHNLNFELHRRINRATNSIVLHRFVTATSRYVSRRSFPDVPGWLEGAASEHGALLDALRRRDKAGARRLMEDHVHDSGERLIADLRRRGWAEGP